MAASLRIPSSVTSSRVEAPVVIVTSTPRVSRSAACASTSGRVAAASWRPFGVEAPVRPCVIAAAKRAAAPVAETKSENKEQVWYALVANADFWLNDVQNESVAEQLRERVRLFKEQGKKVNFWLVPNPTWLDTKYAAQGKQVRRPCVALVSSDLLWINFMKLRLDRVLKIELGVIPEEEALQSSAKLPEFKPPAKWTAPYSRYTPGWWNVFIPEGAK